MNSAGIFKQYFHRYTGFTRSGHAFQGRHKIEMWTLFKHPLFADLNTAIIFWLDNTYPPPPPENGASDFSSRNKSQHFPGKSGVSSGAALKIVLSSRCTHQFTYSEIKVHTHVCPDLEKFKTAQPFFADLDNLRTASPRLPWT